MGQRRGGGVIFSIESAYVRRRREYLKVYRCVQAERGGSLGFLMDGR